MLGMVFGAFLLAMILAAVLDKLEQYEFMTQ